MICQILYNVCELFIKKLKMNETMQPEIVSQREIKELVFNDKFKELNRKDQVEKVLSAGATDEDMAILNEEISREAKEIIIDKNFLSFFYADKNEEGKNSKERFHKKEFLENLNEIELKKIKYIMEDRNRIKRLTNLTELGLNERKFDGEFEDLIFALSNEIHNIEEGTKKHKDSEEKYIR